MVNRHTLLSLVLAVSPFLRAESCTEALKKEANLAVYGASAPAYAEAAPTVGFDSSKSATPQGLKPYGVAGDIKAEETVALLHLAWPQSYEAIVGRFGYPAYRTETQDFYQLPNGRWAAINYSGRTALGYSLSDSQ